jgi:hypothetical protein
MAELASSTSSGEKGGTIDSIHPFSLVLSIGCWPAASENTEEVDKTTESVKNL